MLQNDLEYVGEYRISGKGDDIIFNENLILNVSHLTLRKTKGFHTLMLSLPNNCALLADHVRSLRL